MGADNSAEHAQRQAQRAEQERQQQIQNATSRIDAIFNAPERQAQYGNFLNALRDYYTGDLNRQKTISDRRLKFSLARNGLTGGSAAADAGRTAADEYNRGVITAERRAQGSVADLRQADTRSRLNLIQLAQSGLDTGNAASQAAEAMRANLAGAQATGQAEGLGDVFANTADIYKRQTEAAQRRKGFETPVGGIYGNPFSRG